MSAPKVLTILWVAITIPVVLVGFVVVNAVHQVQPGVVTKVVVEQPTASPSAAVVPTVKASSASANNTVKPVVKGGVVNESLNK